MTLILNNKNQLRTLHKINKQLLKNNQHKNERITKITLLKLIMHILVQPQIIIVITTIIMQQVISHLLEQIKYQVLIEHNKRILKKLQLNKDLLNNHQLNKDQLNSQYNVVLHNLKIKIKVNSHSHQMEMIKIK